MRFHNDDFAYETNCFVCDHDGRQDPERQRGLRAEATATFSKLGDAQLKRAARDTIDPSMRLD